MGEIVTKHIAHKELPPRNNNKRIYKEHSKLKNKEANNQLNKQAKELNQTLPQREYTDSKEASGKVLSISCNLEWVRRHAHEHGCNERD